MQINQTFVNFEQAFATSSEPIAEFFSQAGIGYYIPLYQREYSWDLENIDQLMDDLCQGAELLLEKDDAILFMGTLILLTEPNNQNINPRDSRAIPSRVDNVIDGQQRISTFALLATLLYMRLIEASKALKKSISKMSFDQETQQELQHVEEEIGGQLTNVIEVFSHDLKRGSPRLKPVIIRGSEDCWTLDESDENYTSDVAKHLANVIRAIEEGKAHPWPKETSPVKRNLRRMNERLGGVMDAHNQKTDDFPPAWQILQSLPQEAIWSYDKPKLKELIINRPNPLTPLEESLCSVVQLLAFTNFVLKRCCFTVIKPTAEIWAFDMFQSLNATGTPLTAIETFKPMVNNYINLNGGYKGSVSEGYFKEVDNFLGQAKTANQKNRLTNEYLITFALVQDGTKLPSQFSAQRRYLEEHYEACATLADREEFMRRMSDLASYRRCVSDASLNAQTRIPLTEGAPELERELAVLCVAYLKKASHKMADTILSRFYSVLRRADDNSRPAARDEFLAVCKALAAFYTLWRAASSNSGLDDAYRKLLRIKEGDKMVPQGKLSWQGDSTALTSANLKVLLRKALSDRHIGDKTSWIKRAETELRYGNGVDQACRFSLLVAAHDTVPDPVQSGLMVPGQPGVQDYLRLEKWLSDDLSTIEHIAPQNSDARAPWDVTLYEDECYQRIGNQTLLPLEINISAGNRGWLEKCLYYRYLVVQNPAVDRPHLEQEAQQKGITLAPQTLQRLEAATHSAHIKPIAAVGTGGQWNRPLVEARSECICNILWDRLWPWL